MPNTLIRLTLICLLNLGSGLAMAAFDLEVEGVDGELEENVRLHLQSWNQLPANNTDDIEEALQDDIAKALQAYGYYQAQVSYQLAGQTLRLDIEPGQPVLWSETAICVCQQGIPVDDFKILSQQHPFEPGEQISHQDYERFKRTLLNQANDLGYLDAQLINSQLQINPESLTANVVINLETGNRYKVGDIALRNTEIKDSLAQILIDTEKDTWFSANLVGDIYNRLLNSGYFISINIALDKQSADTVNLNIDVVDAPEHDVSTGIGYGTDTGPRFQVKWQRPHVTTRGNSLQSQVQLSQIQQSLSFRYRIPWQHPQNRYLSWDSGYRRKEVEDTVTQVSTTGLIFHLLRQTGWQYSAGVNLDNERSLVGDVIESDLTYVIPSIHASKRNVTGDPNDPQFAYKFWINIANSTDFLGSDTNFTRLHVGASNLFTVGEKHSVASRFEAGLISADEFQGVPFSQRFLTGGDQSIRGFKFENIAPLDDQGEIYGGRIFSAASLEYRYRFLPQWQIASFVDGGRSYLNQEDCDTCLDLGKDYRTSAGLGVRWLSPVGFIAFDVAFPLKAVGLADEKDSPRLHLYLGTPL